jgi:SM-20-related protein
MLCVEPASTALDLAAVSATIAAQGYAIVASGLSPDTLAGLVAHIEGLNDDDFTPAGVGRQQRKRHNSRIRSDEIHWVDESQFMVADDASDDSSYTTEAVREYFQLMETIRLSLNKALFMGLFEFESHFARYTPGAFYLRHLDAFAADNHRVLSSVLYLNNQWQPDDGGELVLYVEPASAGVIETACVGETSIGQPIAAEVVIAPLFGTLVLFLSEVFPHEVLPTRKTRYSLAGWFRRNSGAI